MIDTIQSIILDFQEAVLDTGIPRHLSIKQVPNKTTVCIGVRRGGKSTYMFQTIQRLLNEGVNRENILYINFFDDRLYPLQQNNLGLIVEAYFGLYPEKKNTENVYCFFDELQMIQHWEPFIDRLRRTEKVEIFITGSSAQMLSKEIATQMRGRALTWEIFPFSFKEFLAYKGITLEKNLSTKKRLLIQKAFDEYAEVGGFPEVLAYEKNLRIKTHQEYFHTVLFRDLVERHNISHPKALIDLSHKLIDNIASLYSINRCTGYLQSLGHRIAKSSVSEYIEWLEDSYFLFTISLFDASLSRSKANPKKIYCIDHAMVNSISSGILINAGHLLENLIFIALRREYPHIYYYKTKTGREVDFILQKENREKIVVQVCETMQNEKSREREIHALVEAMDELGLTQGFIVSRHTSEDIIIDNKKITMLPAWRFILNLPFTP